MSNDYVHERNETKHEKKCETKHESKNEAENQRTHHDMSFEQTQNATSQFSCVRSKTDPSD
jgi:hypothetical protein